MQALRIFLRHPTISILETCITLKQINQFHSQLLVNGFLHHPDLISKFAASIALKHPTNVEYAVQLLELDPSHFPTVFAFNSFIRVYSNSSTPESCFRFYKSILQSNQKPDNYTFTFLIKSCARFKDLGLGLAVHSTALKYGFHQDPHIQSGLINMYAEMGLLGPFKGLFLDVNQTDLVTQTATLVACARLGDIDFARQLFDKMTDRDVIAWNAMIAGYVQCGEPLKGLELFYMMETKGLKVNEGSMVSVLSACTRLGALDTGRWAHRYIEHKKLKLDVTLGSALVDMYAKCGDINMAMEVFWGMKEKNVYTWSAAMGGLVMNGYGDKCVELYRRMRHEDVMPNEVTFTSVLKGCSVAGLVEEGCKLFESMINEFEMEPGLEHYGCMVDLYGLSGRLEEALNFIYSMPIQPYAGAWGALLKACKLYNNVEIAELASRKMVELEGGNKDGAYVQLSNIYADFNKWDSVRCVRQKMKSNRVAKVPGVSLIEALPWP